VDEEPEITKITLSWIWAKVARAHGAEFPEPADDPEPEGLERFELPEDTFLN
jgi:hypothetical protein